MKFTIIRYKFYCALFDFWFKIAEHINKKLNKINAKCKKISDNIVTDRNDHK